jgi:hypothetical protein
VVEILFMGASGNESDAPSMMSSCRLNACSSAGKHLIVVCEHFVLSRLYD